MSKTINQKMSELDELIAWFNSDSFELEAAVDMFKKAEGLAGEIENGLMEMKNTITVLGERFDQDVS